MPTTTPRKKAAKKISIYQIAAETGFNPSTVSRALRNQADIGADP